MAAPWEKYQKQAPAEGPWTKFAAPVQTQQAAPSEQHEESSWNDTLKKAQRYINYTNPVGQLTNFANDTIFGDDPDAFVDDVGNRGVAALYSSPPLTTEDLIKGKKRDPRNNPLGRIDATVRGAADTLSFGFADEAAAGANAALGSGDYASNVRQERAADELDAEKRLKQRVVGQIAGAGLGAAGMAQNGLSFAANAANSGKGLIGLSAASAGDGALIGALSGFGSGEGFENSVDGAKRGMLIGGALGGATPGLVAGLSTATKYAARPFASYLNPEGYADDALNTYMRRSGKSVDELASALRSAQDDSQGMYNVADAMGETGQRALIPIARTPNNARQELLDALMSRQSGQGERVSSFMADAFDASETAAQRAAKLTAQRTADADLNYAAARNGAGSVDPSKAIQAADDFIQPGAQSLMAPSNIADDSVEGTVRKARSYLTDGKSVVSDFNSALRAKRELDAMMEGSKPTVQRQLKPIRDQLDDALSAASPEYANARDTFHRQSKAIEAIDKGVSAASSRTRAADSIEQFNAMSPEEQAAFRPGYADPLIGRVESTSMSPTTNKVRPLLTEKTKAEFPAFAVPGKANHLSRRLAREQTMFDTAQKAAGGSKTMDNIAEDSGLENIELLKNLVRGNFKQAGETGIRYAADFLKGTPASVKERLAKALMETDPKRATEILRKVTGQQASKEEMKAILARALTVSGAAAAGR